MSGSVHYTSVSNIQTLAADVLECVLRLRDDDAALSWRPGQFLSLACGKNADGDPILRSYSIANRPGSGEIRLVAKLIAGGVASEWFKHLSVGDEVRFTGPMGFFVLDLSHPGDQIFGATGAGIVPFVPMIEESLARPETGRVHLLWGLRSEEDLFWRREIDALAASPRFASTVHLTRGSDAWPGPRGRINAPLLDLLPSLAAPTFYLCGNGAMIREVKAALVERGVDRKKQIRTEAFYTGPPPKDGVGRG